ncbi:cytochrome c family protein [Desulfovibrio sp. OttesenSCG-928-C06]|nr:cytochrome c family protein [Desulfovibrio sp. OttesenSCG-928-C06]
MKRKTFLARGLVFAAAFTLCAGLALPRPALAAEQTAAKAEDKARAVELVTLDGGVAAGKSDLPPVSFFHSKHEAIKDCATCHTAPAKDGGVWSWDFKNSASALGASGDVKDFYHSSCVTCHEDGASKGFESGPGIAECRSCHVAADVAVPGDAKRATVDFSMGSELHDLHMESSGIEANDDGLNCGACHHVYDAEAKKLVPDYEPAEGCRSCHGESAVANPANPGSMILSFKDASHSACISCHLDMSLPTSCDSCHSVAGQ